MEATQPVIFSADETTDIGADSATPVSDDYSTQNSTFTDRVRWVQIDLGEDAEDADPSFSPEERCRVAVALQQGTRDPSDPRHPKPSVRPPLRRDGLGQSPVPGSGSTEPRVAASAHWRIARLGSDVSCQSSRGAAVPAEGSAFGVAEQRGDGRNVS